MTNDLTGVEDPPSDAVDLGTLDLRGFAIARGFRCLRDLASAAKVGRACVSMANRGAIPGPGNRARLRRALRCSDADLERAIRNARSMGAAS